MICSSLEPEEEVQQQSTPACSVKANNTVGPAAMRAVNNAAAYSSLLSAMPLEVLELVLAKLDARTLVQTGLACKLLRQRSGGLRLTERAARSQIERRAGPALAARWRSYSWLERLQIEETCTSFDRDRCERAGFTFVTDSSSRVTSIKLEGIGPKLLISDLTTHDVPLLRWRMAVKGNNAVEWGVVPVELQESAKALHKCYRVPNMDDENDNRGRRPTGFCSAITVGSLLPVKLPLMHNSVVEIIARRDRLEYIVTNPSDGMEMIWQNSVTVPKPYTGPLEFRFEQEISPLYPVKLAVTCWARAVFDVLHLPELAPASAPQQQQSRSSPPPPGQQAHPQQELQQPAQHPPEQ